MARFTNIQHLATTIDANLTEPAADVLTLAAALHPTPAVGGSPREAADVLIDVMRGRSSTWTRVRVNLQNVPEPERPAEATPDPDYDPKNEYR